MMNPKSILCFLAALCCILLLASCEKAGKEPVAADVPVSEPTAQESVPVSSTVREAVCGYTVIRPDLGGPDTVSAMQIIREALDGNPTPSTDWVNERLGETIPANNREILLGATNRASSKKALEALTAARPNSGLDFSVSFYENEVVIAAGSETVLPEAAAYFIENVLDNKMADYPAGTCLTVQHEYPLTSFCGLNLTGLDIVCAEPALSSQAKQLAEYISVNTGFSPAVRESGTGVVLSLDPAMEPQAYEADFSENGVTVRGGHLLSVRAALERLMSGSVVSPDSFSGILETTVPLTMHAPRDGSLLQLVWNDEFDGDVLDPEKWTLKAKMSQGDITNGTDEHNVTVQDGKLLMRSWQEEDGSYSTNTSVTTDGTMSYRYGYLEMYANVPYITGAWPSFWMQSKDTHRTVPYMTEIDIFEVFGSHNSLTAQLHKWYDDGTNYQLSGNKQSYYFLGNKTLNEEYHLYGFGWTPEEMYFTVDGEIFFSYDLSVDFGDSSGMDGFHDPLFIIYNNFLFTSGSDWQPTRVSAKTEYPICYSVDWVRLYQKPDEGELFYDAELGG